MTNGILIEPLINNKAHGVAVQEKSFSFGLRITNKQESPSDEFNISEIKLFSDNNREIVEEFKKSFFINKLNQGKIWS